MQQAVVYDNAGRANFELSASELVFPITVEQNGHQFVALFHMSNYTPRDLDETLRQSGFRGRQAKGWVHSDTAPLSPIVAFFDRNFIRMSGVEGDPPLEVQKAYLGRKPQLKRAVFTLGYGGVREIEMSPNGTGSGKLTISLEESSTIHTDVPLWSVEKERAELVRVSHTLRAENEQDFEKWDKANKQSQFSVKGDLKIASDHLALGAIYDSMAESIDGALYKGQPCSSSNRDEWIPRLPLWHKSFVMDELFGSVSGKNG